MERTRRTEQNSSFYGGLRLLEITLYVPVWFAIFGAYEIARHVLELCSRILLLGANQNLTRGTANKLVVVSTSIWISYTAISNYQPTLSVLWLSWLLVLLVAIVLFVSVPALWVTPNTLAEINILGESDSTYRWFAHRLRNNIDCVWFSALPLFSVLPILFLICAEWASNPAPSLILYLLIIANGWGAMDAFEHADGHYRFLGRANNQSRTDSFIFTAIGWFFCYPLNIAMGRIPGWYSIQHNVIHHAEDNGIEDTQSTLKYDRASYFDYLIRINRFALSGFFPIDVVHYLRRRRHQKCLRKLLLGNGVFYFVVALISLFNPLISFSILFARYFGLMLSGTSFFQEHGMVDINEPQNIYRNSLNFISSSNDHGSLGDNIHIEHHLHPARHWSNYVASAKESLATYAHERALAFNNDKGDTRDYYGAIWRRDFASLAELFVVMGRPNESKFDIARLLEERSRPYGGRAVFGIGRTIDISFGTAASWIVPNV